MEEKARYGSYNKIKSRKNKRRKVSRKYTPVPHIDGIESLIEVGLTGIKYSDIDMRTLWDILPELQKLDKMVGMKSLKETIFYQIVYYLQNLNVRSPTDYLHTVIIGPPGCGKTSVAMIIGELYKKMKILSPDGSFRLAKREDLVGEYLGQTSVKTKRLLTSCLGGVLFIDEVYSLGSGRRDKDSYSKEAIDTLNVFLSENKESFCCIVAGYEDEIKRCFFSVNAGLERRFQWIHKIDEYSDGELSDITLNMIGGIGWETTVKRKEMESIISSNKDLFKNLGGDAENFVTKCKLSHAKRVFPLDSQYKFIITMEDVEGALVMMEDHKFSKSKDRIPDGLYV